MTTQFGTYKIHVFREESRFFVLGDGGVDRSPFKGMVFFCVSWCAELKVITQNSILKLRVPLCKLLCPTKLNVYGSRKSKIPGWDNYLQRFIHWSKNSGRRERLSSISRKFLSLPFPLDISVVFILWPCLERLVPIYDGRTDRYETCSPHYVGIYPNS